jgi:hypothetical protein
MWSAPDPKAICSKLYFLHSLTDKLPIKKTSHGGWQCSPVVQHLPSTSEALSSIHNTEKKKNKTQILLWMKRTQKEADLHFPEKFLSSEQKATVK